VHLVAEAQSWDPFPPVRHVDDAEHRRAANRAVVMSAFGLGLTGLVETAIALLSGSVGLLADALHNLSDVSTALVVYVGFRLSTRPATAANPYGYERAEDIAGLGVALAIWASAVFAGFVSIHKLSHHGHTTHLGLGMAAAAVGIIGNQVVARYKGRVGRRIQSATLVADAHHSWLDALSSAGALLGLLGVALGLPWADGVAGLVVTGFIIHVGWQVSSEIVAHLMDGVDPELLATAETAALTVTGVEHVHARGRWIGRSLVIEIEGFLPGSSTLQAADELGQKIRDAVTNGVPEARAVLWSPHALAT
jgi:cation diffusion facilitator family transporter